MIGASGTFQAPRAKPTEEFVRIGDVFAKHLYDVDTTEGSIEVDANNRNQAHVIATAHGYSVRSVNLIG